MKLKRRTLKYKRTPEIREQETLKFAAKEARKAKQRMESLRHYRIKKNIELITCTRSLNFLNELSEVLALKKEGKAGVKNYTVLDLQHTADALQIAYTTLLRRIEGGVIPAPVLYTIQKTRHPKRYYHVEEVKTLVNVIGKHENEFSYLRSDHKDAVKHLREAIKKVRSQYL